MRDFIQMGLIFGFKVSHMGPGALDKSLDFRWSLAIIFVPEHNLNIKKGDLKTLVWFKYFSGSG